MSHNNEVKEEYEKARALFENKPRRHTQNTVWNSFYFEWIQKVNATHPLDSRQYSSKKLREISEQKGIQLSWAGWIPEKSWTLWASSDLLGVYCEDENNSFIDCKIDSKDPYHCRKQSVEVTKCAKKMFEEVYLTCADTFEKYSNCIRVHGDLPEKKIHKCHVRKAAFHECANERILHLKPVQAKQSQ